MAFIKDSLVIIVQGRNNEKKIGQAKPMVGNNLPPLRLLPDYPD